MAGSPLLADAGFVLEEHAGMDPIGDIPLRCRMHPTLSGWMVLPNFSEIQIASAQVPGFLTITSAAPR